MPDPILFDSWPSLIRIPLVGLLAYAALILMLRVSGKRTLSKMNAFDLIVTVALGSTLSTVLLDDGIPLAEGVAALALLICLQYAITWASVRSPRFQGLIKAEPALLVHRGRYLPDPGRGPGRIAPKRTVGHRRGPVGHAGDRRLDDRRAAMTATARRSQVLLKRWAVAAKDRS